MIELLIFLAVILFFVGPILGIIAIVRVGSLTRHIKRLQAQIDARGLGGASIGVFPPPMPEVSGPPIIARSVTTEPIAPPPPPPRRATPLQTSPRTPAPNAEAPSRDWEQLIAGNWAMWIGGVILSIGGVFLVGASIEAGLFTPPMRIAAGFALGLGLIAAGVYARRLKTVQTTDGALIHLPAILASAGLIALYGAALAGGAIFNLYGPLVSLVLLVLVSAGAVVMGLMFGPVLAAMGLSGAYISPLLTGAEGGSPLMLLPYVALVSFAGLALCNWQGWRFVRWIMLAGNVFWGWVSMDYTQSTENWMLPTYAIIMALGAAGFAAPYARNPLPLRVQLNSLPVWLSRKNEPVLNAYSFWIYGCVLLIVSSGQWSYPIMPLTSGLVFLLGSSAFLAWKREGLALTLPISAITGFAALALTPAWSEPHLIAAAVMSLGLAILGLDLVQRVTGQAPVTFTGALAPIGGLILAYWKLGGAVSPLVWGSLAVVIAAANLYLLDRLKFSNNGLDSYPIESAALALSGMLALAVMPFLMVGQLWIGSGLAIGGGVTALTFLRFPLRILSRGGAAIMAAGTTWLLRPDLPDLIPSGIGSGLLSLGVGFGTSIAAAILGGAVLARVNAPMRRGYYGAAGILSFALIGLVIRLLAGDGDLRGPFGGLGEMAGYAIAYLGAAVSMAVRFPDPDNKWVRIPELVLVIVGAGAVSWAFVALFWDKASGITLFNLLLPAFAMPALILRAYGYILARRGREGAQWPALSGLCVGLVWATAEMRRMFVGSHINFGAIWDASSFEMWGYSAVWLIYGFGAFLWGLWRAFPLFRTAGLSIIALVSVKILLHDTANLGGVWRALSFLALGGILLAVAYVYQKSVQVQKKNVTTN